MAPSEEVLPHSGTSELKPDRTPGPVGSSAPLATQTGVSATYGLFEQHCKTLLVQHGGPDVHGRFLLLAELSCPLVRCRLTSPPLASASASGVVLIFFACSSESRRLRVIRTLDKRVSVSYFDVTSADPVRTSSSSRCRFVRFAITSGSS